ncbi:hypothetical protein [Sphingomonas colocasiae]|uniref:Uncharacterized protein n=1 Tax=Sphingomonas colocasiae TaxID=1848973 RepID=A0ABS7PUL6_9SPHN|nr:hypothetical protein [Sphingomonas colocasiae]MBY8825057.1 hypothetical protein [Sphingomonas colocasiae]
MTADETGTELDAIAALLWAEWDPIGVNDDPDAAGEYDGYAEQVHAMLKRGADADEVARHLSWTVRVLIGLSTTDEHSLRIARKAVAIHGARAGG